MSHTQNPTSADANKAANDRLRIAADEVSETRNSNDAIDTFNRFEKLRHSPLLKEVKGGNNNNDVSPTAFSPTNHTMPNTQQHNVSSSDRTVGGMKSLDPDMAIAHAQLQTREHGDGQRLSRARIHAARQRLNEASPKRLMGNFLGFFGGHHGGHQYNPADDNPFDANGKRNALLGVGAAAYTSSSGGRYTPLRPAQDAYLKNESIARGGFMNHLKADYDLHRRCALPPQQARFEAGIIFAPLTGGNVSSGDRAAVVDSTRPSSHIVPNPATYYSAETVGAEAASWHSANASTLSPRDDVAAAEKEAARQEILNLYSHTDYYHLAADYDLHRKCPLPPSQARFESNVVDTTDWTIVEQQLRSLQKEFPHLHITERDIPAAA